MFETGLEFYFKKKGKQLVHAEKIKEKFSFDCNRSIVTGRHLDGRKEEKLVKMSLPYPNTNNDIEENWSYTIKHIQVTQKFKYDVQGITVIKFQPKEESQVYCTKAG